MATLQGHERMVTFVSVLQDGRVVSGAEDKTLRIWGPTKYMKRLRDDEGDVPALENDAKKQRLEQAKKGGPKRR